MQKINKFLMAVCLCALLAGCTMAPVYQRPAPPLPTDWTSGTASQTQPGAVVQDWRQVIVDQPTQKLVELALANNRDLRAATARIEKAQAAFQIVRANLFPKIDAFAKAELNPNTSKRMGNNTNAYHSYVVGVGFSNYELDFFGRVRSLKDQALELYLSTEAAQRAAQLSLVAEVGTIYLRLVADREHLAAAQEILQAEKASYELIKVRHAEGAASDIDLNRAETSLDIAQTNAAQFAAQATIDENALAVLVGQPLQPDQMPAKALAEVKPLTSVPAGLPSEILTRRPDVLEAEHQLKAANAYIGAARALHFPIITLTSSFGTASNRLNGLFKAGSWAWSLSPQVSVPIFHTGAIRATVNEAFADRDIMIAMYDKAIQNAFREVSDSLALRAASTTQVEAQSSLVKATGKVYDLATYRYEVGQDSYLSKLDAQRNNAQAQHDYIGARYAQQTNTLTLYKALGGGWNGEDAPEPGYWVTERDGDEKKPQDAPKADEKQQEPQAKSPAQ